MAKKRKAASPAQAKTLSPRKTRSATRNLAGGASPAPVRPAAASKAGPAPKKAKVAKGKARAKTEEAVEVSDKAPPPLLGAGKSAAAAVAGKTVIIEACKQCQSFNRTAVKVKDGLEKHMSDITVSINPDKPRRGCFEVRASGGEIFVSLLDMKRPFKPMKELNLLDVVTGIVEKLK